MKKIFFLLLPIIIFFLSCNQIIGPETTSEEWIATIDIDGTNLEYVCESDGAGPFFVPDLQNSGDELILLSYSNRIDLMNIDGTDRRTIIDSVGTVFSFSHDKTKMLLNYEGDIYIANVDGTEFQNLTNTPDILETDPSFSNNNEKIVYSYRLNNGTHAYLVIKDLATNQDSIIFEYDMGRNAQGVSFTYPSFQNDNQILYRFYLIDQSEEPQIFRNELHRFNMNSSINEIIINDMVVGNFVFSNILNQTLVKIESTTILFDLTNLAIIHEFANTSISTVNRFSPNANYLSVGKVIYSIIDDIEYYIDTEENDFNQTEAKIVGVTNRSYPEDKED